MAAPDILSAQSAILTRLRADLGTLVSVVAALGHDRLKFAAVGPLEDGVFSGDHGDVSGPDVEAALAALSPLRAALYDPQGEPTPGLLAIARLAR